MSEPSGPSTHAGLRGRVGGLIDRIGGVHLLGIRSKTNITPRVLDSAKNLVGVGAFCIGTNQIDLHAASERMTELARSYPWADGLTARALNQAARELMLAQSSDWSFIMKTGTTVPYATRRFNEHIIRFNRLYDDLRAGKVSETFLADIESKDNIFPNVGYQVYAT